MAMRLGLTAQSRPLSQAIAKNFRSLTAIPSHALARTIVASSAAPLFGGSTSMQQQARASSKARAAAVRCGTICATCTCRSLDL